MQKSGDGCAVHDAMQILAETSSHPSTLPCLVLVRLCRNHGFLLFALLSLIASAVPLDAIAINASPHPSEVKQPDGTQVTLRIQGDEYFNWMEDTDGYTVVRSNGKYVYARLNAGKELAPTAWAV